VLNLSIKPLISPTHPVSLQYMFLYEYRAKGRKEIEGTWHWIAQRGSNKELECTA